MKTTDKFTAYTTDTRRDKYVCFASVAALFILAADLWLRGADSLYGSFFLWLVLVGA